MAKEIACQSCGKVYWDDLDGCPRCEYKKSTPEAPEMLDSLMSDVGAAANHQTTTFPRRKSGKDVEETTWPTRGNSSLDSEETIMEEVQTGLIGLLVVKVGSRRGQVHRIQHDTTIGRENATLIIRDPKISRPHARFTIQNDQLLIWDFGTPNGTLVNDQRIDRGTPLNENDVIQIGDTIFVLKLLV